MQLKKGQQKGLPPHELAKVKIWLGLQRLEYDPNQPRDEGGKWTSGGGGGGGGGEGDTKPSAGSESESNSLAKQQKFVDGIAERYGLPRQQLKLDDTLGDHALAHASGEGISINSQYWNDAKKMEAIRKEWHGLRVDATTDSVEEMKENILVHEMGHKALQQIKPPVGLKAKERKAWYDEKWNIVKRYYDDNKNPPSAYGQEHPDEWAAEAFVSMHTGKSAWPDYAEHMKGVVSAAKTLWSELYRHGDRDPETGRPKPGAKPRAGG